jgi:hypothetical protein
MKRWALALVAVGLMGCAPARSPIMVDVAPRLIRIDKPPVYRVWWDQMERCTKRRGDYHRWRVIIVETPVPGKGFLIEGLKDYELAGYTDSWSHILYVDQESMFLRDVVAHEMVHALGVIGHPKVFDECGVR